MPAASDSLRADLQALRQEVAALRQVLREAALLIATEVRAGTGGTTEAVRKLRATVRDAA
jgi:pyridoxal biosynthesis lyase PdxS